MSRKARFACPVAILGLISLAEAQAAPVSVTLDYEAWACAGADATAGANTNSYFSNSGPFSPIGVNT